MGRMLEILALRDKIQDKKVIALITLLIFSQIKTWNRSNDFFLVFNINRCGFIEPSTTFAIVAFIDISQYKPRKFEYLYFNCNLNLKVVPR